MERRTDGTAAAEAAPSPRTDAARAGEPISLSFLTPMRERCGVSDYSRRLIAELRALPEIAALRLVEAPPDAARPGLAASLRCCAEDNRRFRALGERVNADGVQIAHVQHQYFLFGGVAPHKTHIRAFLDAVRVPMVMTVHEIVTPGARDSVVRRGLLGIANRVNFLHPAIRKLIVHTRADRQALVDLGVAPERIHVVAIGVPDSPLLPDPEEARAQLGLTGRRILTLFGFLSSKKGHHLAIESMRMLPDDVALLFAGDQHPDDHGDYVPRLRSVIATAGLGDRVRITGYLSDDRLPVVLAATDIAIAPFPQTSGSASMAQLLAAARPIVASDIAPHRDIASEQPSCLELFPSGDAAGLAICINSLLERGERRAELMAAARAYSERHSYAAMARETAAIYRTLL